MPPVTGGNPTNLTIDDVWSGVIALPFEFNFYGNPYTNVVAAVARLFNGYYSEKACGNNRPGKTCQTHDKHCKYREI